MKKISMLVLALLLWFIPACDDDDDSTSSATGTLVVNYDFSGGAILDADTGTRYVYVYLYTKLGLFPDDFYIEEAQSDSPFTEAGAKTGTITMTKVNAGDYYMLVFYDKKEHTNKLPGNTDLYMLYDGVGPNYSSGSPYDATNGDPDAGLVTITKGQTETIDMVYESAAFQSQGAWDI